MHGHVIPARSVMSSHPCPHLGIMCCTVFQILLQVHAMLILPESNARTLCGATARFMGAQPVQR